MLDATRCPEGHEDAAVAGAASTVLSLPVPRSGSRVRRARAAVSVPRRRSSVGAGSASASSRGDATDGSDAVYQGTIPVGPGLWVPTPPGFLPAARATRRDVADVEPESGSQFRPGPPPAFGSAAYAAETREVYDVSQTLTDEQKRIADFWADGAGTVTPPGHWNQIALDLIRAQRLSDGDAAEVLAALNTAQADAFIACWDAKYTYWSERPVTAIRRELDPTWSSYIATPPFPSYVSGHSTTSGAASEVLAALLPAGRRPAPRVGRGGRNLAAVRRYPLPERQRGRACARQEGRGRRDRALRRRTDLSVRALVDDEDVAARHALDALAHAVTEQALDRAELARPDDDEVDLVARARPPRSPPRRRRRPRRARPRGRAPPACFRLGAARAPVVSPPAPSRPRPGRRW